MDCGSGLYDEGRNISVWQQLREVKGCKPELEECCNASSHRHEMQLTTLHGKGCSLGAGLEGRKFGGAWEIPVPCRAELG